MKRLAAFVTYYARQPGVMRRHLGDAARTLARHGVKSLLADIRAVSAQIAADRRLQRVAAATPKPQLTRNPASDPREGTIVIVVHDMTLGGAQQVAQSFAAWLVRQNRFAVRIVAMRGGPFRAHFQAVAPVFCIADHARRDPQTLSADLARWAGPQVRGILVNSVASGRFFDYWNGAEPAIGFVHEMPKIIERHRAALTLLAGRADRLVAGSLAVCRALEAHADLPPRVQLYPFVDDDAPAISQDRAGRQAARAALGASADEVLVCGCGVLHWRKAPERFVDVARRVLAQHDGPIRFVWIGGGPDLDACRRLIRREGLDKRVRITDYQADATGLLRAADIFLLPSVEDAFPLVAMHAALAAAPILCFAEAGGMPELVAQGCGTVLPNGDVEAMAQAVCAYAADPLRRQREGAVGRKIVAARMTVSQIGPHLLDALLAQSASAPAMSLSAAPRHARRIAG
ncbi:MAG: glycosyltransferase family 4 protein [Pseudomonadota bacterium]